MTSLWKRLLGLGVGTVVEGVDYDEVADGVVAHVRPRKTKRGRCGRCGRPARRYDQGEGRRRWRALDLGTVRVWLEADAPRVDCPDCGVTVAWVPWARHGAGHTRNFDDTVAWLVTRCSKTTVTTLLRIGWRTVGSIITRVSADIDARVDRLEGLRRIGIDEISYKKGHKYLVVVVDHDTGRLVWAAPGRTRGTVRSFFDALGEERSRLITHISADEAEWIADVVAERCPQAVRCADPFHVVRWATRALDEVRRQVWNDTRAKARTEPKRRPGRPRQGTPPRTHHEQARRIKGARYALLKNPENLTARQEAKLAWIAKSDPRLWRAYLLKEGLRHVFSLGGEEGKTALDRWLAWAQRSRLPSFVQLGRLVRRHRTSIDATLDHQLSNALVESTNTKIRLLTRIAYGFHSPQPLIALAMLHLGGHQPNLPGRAT